MRFLARLRRPGRRVLAGIAASVLVATGAAAYWAVTGTGSATSTAGTPQAVTVSPGVPSTRVYPGGTAAVAVTLSNPNAYPVRIRALALDTTRGTSGFAVDGGHSACGVGSLSYATQDNAGSGWTVPPRVGGVNGSLPVELTGALSMAADAGNACQGASFTVYLNARPDYSATVLATAGLVSYWRLGGDPEIADGFTGTAGTALSAHTGNLRTGWVHQTGTSPAVITAGGRVRKNGTGGASLDYAAAVPSTPDYAVEADIYHASDLAGDKLGVAGRYDPATGQRYLARFDRADNGWHVLKMVNETATDLGCWCAGGALQAGRTYRLRLDISGAGTTSLKLSVDGVQRVSVSDSTSPYTAAGRAGLQDGDAASTTTKNDATGLHADNFRLVTNTGTAVADSKGANTGTFGGTVVRNEPGAPAGDLNRASGLNGTGYATVPDSASLDLGDGPFTLEAWVRRADTATTRQTLAHRGAGSYQWAFDNNRISLYKEGTGLIVQSTTTQTDTAAYHHYAVIKTGSTVRLYVDGLDVTGPVTGQTLTNTATALVLGSRSGSADFLNGHLDEFAVYNTALTANAIADHAQVGV